jgi:riboflavin kinase/FMN adenylyltransferase
VKLLTLGEAERRPRRVAVGTFDGVHLGHRRVIDGSDTVLTFDPHPVAVVAPHAAPKLLTTLARKAELIEAQGVDELVVIPFDKEFAAQPAEAFVDEVLLGRLGAERVAVGENFRFGHRAQGDTELLRADGRFDVQVEPLLEVDGEVASSWAAPSSTPASCSARRSRWPAPWSTATSAAASSASPRRT